MMQKERSRDTKPDWSNGYFQKNGEDYDGTFAPVVNHISIRTLLGTEARIMHVEHLNVKSAFLHGG